MVDAIGVTISTHGGKAYSLDHNRRVERVIKSQPHIDGAGQFEEWHYVNEKEAYTAIFGKAQRLHNAKQKRADRKILDYHAKVKADGKLNSAYEMIISVGNRENPVDPRLHIV